MRIPPYLAILFAALAGLGTVSASSAPAQAEETRRLSGQIMVVERMALPDDAMLIIDVTDAQDTPMTAVRRLTDGAQSPFDFDIEVPRDRDLVLRVGLRALEDAMWLSEPLAIAADDEDRDLGALRAIRIPLMGYAALLNCTGQLFEIGFMPDEVRLRFNEQLISMTRQISASGEAFVAPDNPASSIHLKGADALVRIDGAELAQCQLIRPEADIVDGVWNISSIEGKPTIFPSRTELVFYHDGRVTASVGCNRLIGSYRRHGGVLGFGRVAATMMACPEALMEQERQFNQVLLRIDGYRFNPETGRLTLLSGGEAAITARR